MSETVEAMDTSEKQEEDTVEDEEMDDEDEEELEEGEKSYVVQEILDIRWHNKRVEYKVLWEKDGSKSWEPIECFIGELKHPEIINYKKRNPKKWESVVVEHKNPRKMTKKYTRGSYVYVNDEEDRYEKPDESVPREARQLADPSRLEDPNEKFLKNYSCGIPGRVSRSKVRDIRRAIALSSAESSPTKSTSKSVEKKQENKKRAPGGGRKKKVKEDEVPTSSPNPVKPSSSQSEDDIGNTSDGTMLGSRRISRFEDGIEDWKPKKRDKPLNSSDSEVEESDSSEKATVAVPPPKPSAPSSSKVRPSAGRKESGGNGPSIPEPVSEASSSSSQAVTKRKTKKTPVSPSLSGSQEVQKKNKRAPRKRVIKSPSSDEDDSHDVAQRKETERDPNIRYADDPDSDLESALPGIATRMTVSEFKEKAQKEFEQRKRNRNPDMTDFAIAVLNLDCDETELCLLEMPPQYIFHKVSTEDKVLHEILSITYEKITKGQSQMEEVEQRKRKCEKVLRLVLTYVPLDILSVQNDDLNTLLQCAMNSKMISLVEHLLELGSPIHLRNKHEMTAVESSIVLKDVRLFEMILKRGGTFHHILDKAPVLVPQEDHFGLKNFMWNKMSDSERDGFIDKANEINRMITTVCREIRLSMSNSILETGHAPIVCFPRGAKVPEECSIQTIQFRIPDDWDKTTTPATRYMLVVMPMVYHPLKNCFVGSQKAPQMREGPKLCGRVCKPFHPAQKTVFFDATNALKAHFANYEECKRIPFPKFPPIIQEPTLRARDGMVRERISIPIRSWICTTTLDISPSVPLSFVACQLIRFESLDRAPSSGSNSFKNGPASNGGSYQRGAGPSKSGNHHYPRTPR